MYRSLDLFSSGRHFQARGSWVSRRAGVRECVPGVCAFVCAACVAACAPFRVCRGAGRTSPYLPISTPLGPSHPRHTPLHTHPYPHPLLLIFFETTTPLPSSSIPLSLLPLTLARLSWDIKWIEHHLRPTKNPRKKSNPTSSPVQSGKTLRQAQAQPAFPSQRRSHTSAV